MNNSQNSYPRPLIMSEDGKLRYDDSQISEVENVGQDNNPKLNLEVLLSQLGKSPSEFLASTLASNLFGNKKVSPLASTLSNLVKTNKSSAEDETTFEDF